MLLSVFYPFITTVNSEKGRFYQDAISGRQLSGSREPYGSINEKFRSSMVRGKFWMEMEVTYKEYVASDIQNS